MIIGLSGKARSGKDTAANYICDRFGFSKYSFAKPIKDCGELLFGWDERHRDGELKEVADPDLGFSPREFYQKFGMFCRESLRDDVWILLASMFVESHENVIVPDVRFQNEYDFIVSRGGVVMHIIRPGQAQIEHSSHASEQGLPSNLNLIQIINDASVDTLKDRLDAALVGHI